MKRAQPRFSQLFLQGGVDNLQQSINYLYKSSNNLWDETLLINHHLDGVSDLQKDRVTLFLSIIATFFLPLSFITGIFGMNFQSNLFL